MSAVVAAFIDTCGSAAARADRRVLKLEHVEHHHVPIDSAHLVAAKVGVENGVPTLKRNTCVVEKVVFVYKRPQLNSPIQL